MPVTKANSRVVKSLNPFEEPPLPKAFYHPGSPKRLSKKDRKTALSPERKNEPSIQECMRAAEDDQFLSGSHRFTETLDPSPKDSSSKFDESWPSSERPSFGDETVQESEPRFDRFLNLRKRLDFPVRDSPDSSLRQSAGSSAKENQTGESVLARYVERFRRGAPMSRQERLKHAGGQGKDFWWLSGSHSDKEQVSHGVKSTRARDSISPYRISSKTDRLTASSLATHLSSRLPGDEETQRLQERADRLLEYSYESSEVSTDPIVSTEGLGSSPSTMSVATDGSRGSEERVYRPVFSRMARESTKAVHVPAPHVSRGNLQRPEDDILYQWRLKRKMELAKESAYMAPSPKPASKLLDVDSKLSEFRQKLSAYRQPSASSVSRTPAPGAVHFTPAPDPSQSPSPAPHATGSPQPLESVESPGETRAVIDPVIEPTIASPTLHRKGKVKVKPGAPEPHLHLMCDLLPCPHQEVLTERLEEGTSLKYTQYLQAERPDSDKKKGSDRSRSQWGEQQEGTDHLLPDDRPAHLTGEQCDRHLTQHARQSEECLSGDKKPEKDKPASGPKRLTGQRTEECDLNQSVDKSARHKQSYSNKTAKKQLIRDNGKSQLKGLKREATPPEQRRAGSPSVSSTHPLDSAVGQVVSGYLFDSSQSVVGSSVESLSQLSGLKSSAETKRTSLRETDDSVGTSSDGEEFSDDAILQQLRQQRSLYENQLREIDELLSQMNLAS